MLVTACAVQILLTQQQLMKAKSDEENKGGGAADARRWNGLRNVVESRALLKTAFRTASTLKAQVLGSAPAMSTAGRLSRCHSHSQIEGTTLTFDPKS